MSAAALRIWEKRYGIVRPKRSESGYRLYSQEDIDVLRGAAALVADGHSIGEVAVLPREELLKQAASLPAPAPLPASHVPAPAHPRFDAIVDEALAAARALDRERFEAALFPVLGLGALAPPDACEYVLMPILRAIGSEWAAGRLDIAAEHFASSIIRAKLLHYLDFLPRPAEGPLAVCACPGDERHELGLLAFAVHAASSGWRTVLLGAGTPFGEATAAAIRLGADLLVLALTMEPSLEERQHMAEELAKARASRALSVMAGGPGAERAAEFLSRIGVEVARGFRPRLPRG